MALMKAVAVIVAHPDDETLWAGGTILDHPAWNVYILTLCRASDRDRAPKFFQALCYPGSEDYGGARRAWYFPRSDKGELAVELPPNFFPVIQPEDPDWHVRYDIYNKDVEEDQR